MFARLLSSIACNFYKTKWTHHLPKKDPSKPLQVNFRNWTITKGDVVKVLAGDDKGKVARVVKVLRKLNRVVVRRVNIH